ncbi:DJ-1/PfpI family protein [Phenylobacterium sp.]|uniref:DJ-1/PfpI family protein n=1 Tax=Phenylobacterium sp. TaxID=1871053 RepID=UPI003D2BE696
MTYPTLRVLALAATLMLGGLAHAAPGPGPGLGVDFDAAMTSLRFAPDKVDANLDASGKPNGLLDAHEMALVAKVINDASVDLRRSGGVSHDLALAAFVRAELSAKADLAALGKTWPQAPRVAAGYAMLGEPSLAAFSTMSAGFGTPMKSDYSSAAMLGRYFGPDGDADGDGVPNRLEYAATISQGREAYLRAALNPEIRPAADAAKPPPATASRKVVGIVLYPGFELLDVFGPAEMWANVPDLEVVLIAETKGPVRSAQGLEVVAAHGFADTPKLDILMTPGGVGTYAQLDNARFLDFLRQQDRQVAYMTSVCTGSALLAKAGLLNGRRATSNKAFFQLAVDQDPSVTWIRRARWVEDGRYFTSSGVSAGTDMSLALVAKLYGQDRARGLARSLEYRWVEDANDDPFARPAPEAAR